MPSDMPKRIDELDGLRGLAALVVLVSHFFGEVDHGFRALALGWYAVDFFFVLSGYLMGSIILKHHAEPGFLKSFYLRRAVRIIPAYFVIVSATLVVVALTRDKAWADHPFSAIVYFTFTTNFAMSIWGVAGEWLTPAWTLAVEEQFYLVLPLIIMLVPRRFLSHVLFALCAGAVLFRFAFIGTNEVAAVSLLPARMDLLLGGVILAHLMRMTDYSKHLLLIRVVPLLAIVVLLITTLTARNTFFIVVNPTLLSVGFGFFLLAVLLGAPEGKRYASPVLRYFGQISYALYLVHQPVAGLLHGLILNDVPDIETLPQVMVTLLAFAVSVAFATASWNWLERPLLKRFPGGFSHTRERSPSFETA